MADLKQLKQDFIGNARVAAPTQCSKGCSKFNVLLDHLVAEGDKHNLVALLQKTTLINNQTGKNFEKKEVIYSRLLEWISFVCKVHTQQQVGSSLYPSLANHFFNFIIEAEKVAGIAVEVQQRPAFYAPITLQMKPISFGFSSKSDQLSEISRNRYVQGVLEGHIDSSKFNVILGLFDRSLSVRTLSEILDSNDVSRLDEAKNQSALLIAVATMNGNERDSDKFGKLMELVDLKFGKKPPRMSEDKFMQNVATELRMRIDALPVPLCVGVQYISTWADRQFIPIQ